MSIEVAAQEREQGMTGSNDQDGRFSDLRVLFLGLRSLGNASRAVWSALRELGCTVHDIDESTFVPNASSFRMRLARRLLKSQFIAEYNQNVIVEARHFRPDILLGCKCAYIYPETVRTLRGMGIRCYNYYPDRVKLIQGSLLAKSIPEYDCFFDTKKYWDGDSSSWLSVKKKIFVPHGYDPELHRPQALTTRAADEYSVDVSYIAACTPRKVPIMEQLVKLRPNLNLAIWGAGGWDQAPSLKKYVKGYPIFGDEYVQAINGTKINLAIMGITTDVVDETTMRTYEIPACRAFMLHERMPEALELFEEGKEMACFSSAEELAEKIDYYLEHPDERQAIAEAGYRRCVPEYSYTNRVRRILEWHLENFC